VSTKGKFKRYLSLSDLTFIGFGAIFGSGRLFSASHVGALAGPERNLLDYWWNFHSFTGISLL
jgi:amino acid permease